MDLLERARLQHKVGTTARPETKKRGEQQEQQQHQQHQQQQQEQVVASFGAAAAAHRGRSTASPKAVSGQVSDKLRTRSRQSTISTNGRTSTVITTSSIFTTEKTADATKTRETTETEKMVEEETTVEALAAASGSEDGMSVTEEPVMMLYPDLPLTSETPPFLPERPRSGSPVIPEGKHTTEIPETSTLTAEEIFTIGTAATTESVERGTQIPSETSTASQPEATITVKLPATETEPTLPTATTLRESSTRSIFELLATSTEMEEEETTFYDEEKMEATTRNPGWSSPERRPKRIRTDGGDRDQEVDVIHSGQYHEVNPGQYREVHPGQYHEQNPGQYHEVRLSTKVI